MPRPPERAGHSQIPTDKVFKDDCFSLLYNGKRAISCCLKIPNRHQSNPTSNPCLRRPRPRGPRRRERPSPPSRISSPRSPSRRSRTLLCRRPQNRLCLPLHFRRQPHRRRRPPRSRRRPHPRRRPHRDRKQPNPPFRHRPLRSASRWQPNLNCRPRRLLPRTG
jgi:hypothetical protein